MSVSHCPSEPRSLGQWDRPHFVVMSFISKGVTDSCVLGTRAEEGQVSRTKKDEVSEFFAILRRS